MPSERDCVEQLLKLTKATKTRKLQLQETIALGLLVSLKWDRAKSGKASRYVPSPTDLGGHDNFTETELSNFRETALELLDQHSERAVSRRQWWSGVLQGLTAAAIWSLVIFVIGVIALQTKGGEIGALIRELTKDNPTSSSSLTETGHPK